MTVGRNGRLEPWVPSVALDQPETLREGTIPLQEELCCPKLLVTVFELSLVGADVSENQDWYISLEKPDIKMTK